MKILVSEIAAARKVMAQERTRRRLVNLVFVVYWLVIFEGVLRKWVWPQYSPYLFFIRDPFVLIIYFIVLKNGMWPRAQAMLIFAYGLALLAVIWTIIQLLTGEIMGPMVLLAGYGWRNYFLYIPLAFIIAQQFRQDDLYRLIRQTLIIAIPIAFLVMAQFAAPSDAVINSSVAGEGESAAFKAFRGGLGHIRPYGTFSSFRGQIQFVVTSITMVLIAWIIPTKQRPIPGLLLVLGASAALACLAVSVSRSSFIHAGLVVTSALVAGFALRGKMAARAWLLPTGLVIVALILYPIVFPDALSAFIARWSEGGALESQAFGSLGVFGRAFYEFYDFVRLIDNTPLFGYGMGLGGNAASVLGVKINGVIPLLIAESDWGRHFIDVGPILAIAFIIFRIILTAWLGVQAFAATRRSGNPMAVLLFGYVGVVLLYGQVTGHGSVTGYAWLFAGFLMAAIQSAQTQEKVGKKEGPGSGPPIRAEPAKILHKRVNIAR